MITLAIATTIALSPRAFAQPAVDGPVTIAVHVSLAPTWFDPAETPGVITPFLTLYALHDALVKRMIFKSVPDESTRLAMLKRAETDVAYSIRGPNAEEVKRTAGLTLKATF